MNALPHHYDLIRKPVVTEKATAASNANTLVFEVSMSATKLTVKEAVEAIFSVEVEAVNVLIQNGKRKVFRGRKGRRRDKKKAYVRLARGHTIDVSTDL